MLDAAILNRIEVLHADFSFQLSAISFGFQLLADS
jgi:hypothetical protein